MWDLLSSFFLIFSQGYFIVAFIIFGYIWLNRTTFYHAMCLGLLGMIVNYALKCTFKIPFAPPSQLKGFAFPSGHIHFITLFYGWLALSAKKLLLRLGLIGLLLAIAMSIEHKGYHNYFDIAGGMFFAFILLNIYNYLKSFPNPLVLPIFIFGSATSLMFYVDFVYKMSPHLWAPYYGLFGFISSEKLFGHSNTLELEKNKQLRYLLKGTATVLSVLVVLGIAAIFTLKPIAQLPSYITELKTLLIGFFIPLSPLLAQKIFRNYFYSATFNTCHKKAHSDSSVL